MTKYIEWIYLNSDICSLIFENLQPRNNATNINPLFSHCHIVNYVTAPRVTKSQFIKKIKWFATFANGNVSNYATHNITYRNKILKWVCACVRYQRSKWKSNKGKRSSRLAYEQKGALQYCNGTFREKSFLNDITAAASRTVWFLKFQQNTVMYEHKTSKTKLVSLWIMVETYTIWVEI